MIISLYDKTITNQNGDRFTEHKTSWDSIIKWLTPQRNK